MRPTLTWKTALTRRPFWMFLALSILAIGMTSLGMTERGNGALLASDGIDTIGTVTGRTTSSARGSGARVSRGHTLEIGFSDVSGRTHTVRQSVDDALYSDTAIDDPVPLRYAQSSADIVEFEPGSTLHNGTLIAAVGGLLAVLALAAFILWRRTLAAMRRAADTGDRRLARVTGHRRRGAGWSGRYCVEWQLDGGRIQRSKAVGQAHLPAVGASISVVIDPRTQRGWWEGEF